MNDEVLISNEDMVHVDELDLKNLKRGALHNERKRIRLCTHKSIDDPLHEMFIVHTKNVYVRPHKHVEKSESFHIIEGLVDVVLFDDDGNIIKIIKMGDYRSGLKFYQRLSKSYFHTLIIKSKILVFHEITSGPFKREDTVFPPWAPPDDVNGMKFIEQIKKKLRNKLYIDIYTTLPKTC